MKSEFDLGGRVALVTGSTKGIGAAMADALETAGAKVWRHGHPAEAVSDALACDLLEANASDLLLSKITGSRPDILVCNAGSFFDKPFLDMDPGTFQKTHRLNVEQAYFLVQGFARQLRSEGRSGAVVLVTSTNGLQAEENSTAYDTSKGALIMMVRSLAVTLAPLQIRVNGIAPGLIRTPLTRWTERQPDRVRHYEKKIPLGRLGVPEEMGGTCVYLCSEASRYMTGQTLVLDGGMTINQIGKFEP